MPIDLHLFSSPGVDGDIRYVIEACRPYLDGRDEARVAYLPLASLYAERWLEQTAEYFKGLAELDTVNAELMTQPEIEKILRNATLVFIPGGNTFLLNHRLHVSKVMPYLKKKVQGGLPVVGFSAGAIVCGPNILTAGDLNTVGTPYFEGLDATPFNFFAHYALDAGTQSRQDDWLADYHFFRDNPVIMLCDGSYVRVEGKKAALIRGEAWIVRRDEEKEQIAVGKSI